MNITYKHTNIVARDWKKLAAFYETVFKCRRILPERHLSGEWLQKATGVKNARLSGVHLGLPGHEDSVTLEIFQYEHNEGRPAPAANREGFAHLAFEVDDVKTLFTEMMAHGGKPLGDITTHTIEGVGNLELVYALDPEGNVIELQSWK